MLDLPVEIVPFESFDMFLRGPEEILIKILALDIKFLYDPWNILVPWQHWKIFGGSPLLGGGSNL